MGSFEKNLNPESHLKGFFERNMISYNQPLIVAVSGGLDSMTLLFASKKLNFSVIAAHVNYGLRGQDSIKDEELVRNYCAQNEIPLSVLDAGDMMKEKSKDSIQMKAREIRRAFFMELLQSNQASHILLGHHWDDQIETFFIQFYRNQGIFSLAGMEEKEGRWLRPFLNLKKQDLLHYANTNRIQWREDASNKKNDYLRNQIRNILLPEISKINPGSKHKAFESVRRLNDDRIVYNELLGRFEKEHVNRSESGFKIKKTELLKFKNPASLLNYLFREYVISYSLIEEICKNLTNSEYKYYQNKDLKITSDRTYLSVIQTINTNNSLHNQEQPTLHIHNLEIFEYNKLNFSKFEAVLDANKIKGELHLRKWEKADRIRPVGMKGSKLVSDYFTDEKFSKEEKENQWILCDDNGIVWLVNQRVDANYAICPQSKRALIVKCIT